MIRRGRKKAENCFFFCCQPEINFDKGVAEMAKLATHTQPSKTNERTTKANQTIPSKKETNSITETFGEREKEKEGGKERKIEDQKEKRKKKERKKERKKKERKKKERKKEKRKKKERKKEKRERKNAKKSSYNPVNADRHKKEKKRKCFSIREIFFLFPFFLLHKTTTKITLQVRTHVAVTLL